MKRSLSSSLLSLLLLLSVSLAVLPIGYAQAATAAVQSDQYAKGLAEIEAKTEARRKELGIPGVSLVIVKDDRIIYMKGLGYKDLENKIAVTPDTQFAIGSATKAFTALSVLMTQDEGKLSLYDSPKKYLPYLKMYDPDTDKNITIRDLMCHSSGLTRTDLAMFTGKLTRQELIQVTAQAKPTGKLREKWQYQNIMFTAAGEIASVVQKQPWERLIPERILKPLGMTNTTMSIREMSKAKDHSFGYAYNFDSKQTTRLPYREIDQVAPAGSINSSGRDMAQWLRFVLNGGTVAGKRLISEKGYEEWLKPQMKIAGTASYGLGWFLQDWNGLKVVQHGGNIDGFNSQVAMIPEKRIGFVLLTNVSASPLGNDLMPIVWQNLLGDNKVDENTKLPLRTMQRLIGKYRLEAAGFDVEVKIAGEDLVMDVPGQPRYTLRRISPRKFSVEGAPTGFFVQFTPATDDATAMVLTQPNFTATLPRSKDDGTTAAAGPPATGPAKELVGKYEADLNGRIAEIKELDGKFVFAVAGQPPFALGEKQKDVYSMAPLPDTYFLTVKRDPEGKIERINVTQPEGEFGFKNLAYTGNSIKITFDELRQKAVDAMGGEANLRKITSRITTFEMDLENQGLKAFGTSYAKAPNKAATETTMMALGRPISKSFEFFDGTSGQEATTFTTVTVFTGKQLADAQLGSDFYGGIDWTTNYKKVEVSRLASAGGEECYAVVFEPKEGTKFTEYYSTKTFLLVKREGVQTLSGGVGELPYTVVYSDYRDVDGIKLPFRTASNSIAQGDVITAIKTVKQNVPIDDKVFGPRKLK